MTLGRFEREAQATAALTSPHTIHLYDFGLTDEGSFHYAMELLDGRDLESLVWEFGLLSPKRAMHLVRQVCRSPAEARAVGLIHRDIKRQTSTCAASGERRRACEVRKSVAIQPRVQSPVRRAASARYHAHAARPRCRRRERSPNASEVHR
jgi:serine/threonine protein kinase